MKNRDIMKIMILGGGKNQEPLVKAAKQNNYFVVLCDYNEKCVCKKYCDVFYLVSTYDIEKLLEVAKKENVDGIITNSEPVLHIVSELTEKLKLPAVPSNIMNTFRNKNAIRNLLTPIGLSDVRYKSCNNIDEAIEFFNELGKKKMIIKPLDSSASKGVFSIQTEEDIKMYFNKTLDANRLQHSVLMEEYIEGTEFTVDGICINGKHYTLAISKKKSFNYNENIADELYFSYEDEEYNYDELRNLNNKIVETTKLTYGMTHAEYKYRNGKFHLIEIAARGGGVYISTKIVPYLTGIDTVKILLDSAMGICNEKISITENAKKRVAILKYFYTPSNESGIVKNITGIKNLENNKNILMYSLNFKVGDFIKPAENKEGKIGYFIAVAESKTELNKTIQDIEKNFEIELERVK